MYSLYTRIFNIPVLELYTDTDTSILFQSRYTTFSL